MVSFVIPCNSLPAPFYECRIVAIRLLYRYGFEKPMDLNSSVSFQYTGLWILSKAPILPRAAKEGSNGIIYRLDIDFFSISPFQSIDSGLLCLEP